jgi:hypothetical protein
MWRTDVIPRRLALALALAAAGLGGCSADLYLDRRNTVSFAAGDAPAANAVTHMVDPWPREASNRNIAFNGERMQSAAERYRTGKTTPLAGTSTSSVQYAPVFAPASK